MCSVPGSKQRFIESDSGDVALFKLEPLLDWMRTARNLLCMLLLLLMTSGQPSGASEMSRLKYANGNGTLRDLFIGPDGAMFTMIPNSKAKNPALAVKGVPRFPPKAVAQLLVAYLVFVRPVLNVLAQRLGMAGHSVMKVYLFCDVNADKHWSNALVALEFKRTISAWFREGRGFGIRQHCHVTVAYSRWHIRESPEEGNTLLDIQAFHSTAVANKVYAIETRRSHPHVEPNVMLYFKRLSAKLATLLHLDAPARSDDQQVDETDMPEPPQQQRVVLLSEASRIVDKALSQGLTRCTAQDHLSFRWHKERHSAPRSHATSTPR